MITHCTQAVPSLSQTPLVIISAPSHLEDNYSPFVLPDKALHIQGKLQLPEQIALSAKFI